MRPPSRCSFFFFNDTATTEIYTLSLHDALPIWSPRPAPLSCRGIRCRSFGAAASQRRFRVGGRLDRKSTRLNSSHTVISYAVFCLKKNRNFPEYLSVQMAPYHHRRQEFGVPSPN